MMYSVATDVRNALKWSGRRDSPNIPYYLQFIQASDANEVIQNFRYPLTTRSLLAFDSSSQKDCVSYQ
jgi:hypothetical protein